MYSIYRDLTTRAADMTPEPPDMDSWRQSDNYNQNMTDSAGMPLWKPERKMNGNGNRSISNNMPMGRNMENPPLSPDTPAFGPPIGNIPDMPVTPNLPPNPVPPNLPVAPIIPPNVPVTPNLPPNPVPPNLPVAPIIPPNVPVTPNLPPTPGMPGNPPVVILPGGNQGNSNIRFLYAAVNQPAVNIKIGNVGVVNNFQYGNVTPYYLERAGIMTITLTDTMTGQILYRGQFTFLRNFTYTMAIINEGDGITIFSIIDNRCPDLVGTGCLRAINLSRTAGPVDIFLNGYGRIFEAVSTNEITPTRRIISGNYRAFVSEALPCGNDREISFNEQYSACSGSRFAIMDSTVVNVKSGTLYTLYIIGDPYNYPALQMLAIESDLIN